MSVAPFARLYLAELSHDLPEETVQYGQLSAKVDVSLKAACAADAVQVGDLIQELLHGAPLHLQKLIHEAHVLLFIAKPAHGGERKKASATFRYFAFKIQTKRDFCALKL